ncbi:hypothetical protein [Desulfosporosinus sp. I2]|uniref:hypothetical protein n=1 Tax=Desulfosporosinus sp. I2 TaxID=1617025 RepID=UPI001A9A443D|nr:hypothetical protein [Desulfosporosinus sp. I2]
MCINRNNLAGNQLCHGLCTANLYCKNMAMYNNCKNIFYAKEGMVKMATKLSHLEMSMLIC